MRQQQSSPGAITVPATDRDSEEQLDKSAPVWPRLCLSLSEEQQTTDSQPQSAPPASDWRDRGVRSCSSPALWALLEISYAGRDGCSLRLKTGRHSQALLRSRSWQPLVRERHQGVRTPTLGQRVFDRENVLEVIVGVESVKTSQLCKTAGQ